MIEFHTDDHCRTYLEELRWPDGITCPQCESKTVSRITTRSAMTGFKFKDESALLAYADKFCNEWAQVLYNDVIVCSLPSTVEFSMSELRERHKRFDFPALASDFESLGFDNRRPLQVAFFPAAFTCCSVIELFAGLAIGDLKSPSTRGGAASNPFVVFLSRYAGYPPSRSFLLLRLFRHKIAHLGMPAPFVRLSAPVQLEDGRQIPGNALITWYLGLGELFPHLNVTRERESLRSPPTPETEVDVYGFSVNVHLLLLDTLRAIVGPKGYLADLQSNITPGIRQNFGNGITHLFPV